MESRGCVFSLVSSPSSRRQLCEFARLLSLASGSNLNFPGEYLPSPLPAPFSGDPHTFVACPFRSSGIELGFPSAFPSMKRQRGWETEKRSKLLQHFCRACIESILVKLAASIVLNQPQTFSRRLRSVTETTAISSTWFRADRKIKTYDHPTRRDETRDETSRHIGKGGHP